VTPRGPSCTHDLTARTVVAKMQGSAGSGGQKAGTVQPGCANQKQLHANHVNQSDGDIPHSGHNKTPPGPSKNGKNGTTEIRTVLMTDTRPSQKKTVASV
jgi:hypothetical protein